MRRQKHAAARRQLTRYSGPFADGQGVRGNEKRYVLGIGRTGSDQTVDR
jgi:hypothetical protein